jgi:hypothetical protein
MTQKLAWYLPDVKSGMRLAFFDSSRSTIEGDTTRGTVARRQEGRLSSGSAVEAEGRLQKRYRHKEDFPID